MVQQLAQLPPLLARQACRCGSQPLTEQRQHLRIESISFRQLSQRASEVAHAFGVHHGHSQPGGLQRRPHCCLPSTAGLHDNELRLESRQLGCQREKFSDPPRPSAAGLCFAVENKNINVLLGGIDANNDGSRINRHGRNPLPCHTGSRAPATMRGLRPRHAVSLLLTDGLAALGGTIEPTPRREEPLASGSSLASCPYLATYKVVRDAGQRPAPSYRRPESFSPRCFSVVKDCPPMSGSPAAAPCRRNGTAVP